MKPYMFLLAAIVTLFSCTACNKDTANNRGVACMAVGDSITVKVKYSKTVEFSNCNGNPYSIGFNKLLDDSRCPKEANCIWAGTARIGISLNNSEVIDTLQLKFAKSIMIHAEPFTLKLESLTPYPSTVSRYPIERYEAVISIKK